MGILSLPSLANKVARQTLIAKKLPHIIVVDGCHNECAKKIVNDREIKYDAYINLEYDLNIKKAGPFTTFEYSDEDVVKVKDVIEEIIKRVSEGCGRK